MAMEYTEEQLKKFNKDTIVQLFLAQQAQLKDIDNKLQLVLEQLAVMNNHRFGKSSEKLDTDNQIAFLEVDGEIVFFNEAEAIASITDYDEDEPVKTRSKKVKGKRAENLKDLPIVPVSHMMSEAELIAEFGENGWYQLEDEIYNRYKFTPAKVEVEEHHVGVYKSKKDNHFKKADHPGYLLRNSLVSESLEAAIINAKYVNAVPLYRQEQEFERYGLHITRGESSFKRLANLINTSSPFRSSQSNATPRIMYLYPPRILLMRSSKSPLVGRNTLRSIPLLITFISYSFK